MKRQASLYTQDWLRVAERDWERVGKRLREEDHDDAAYRLQQALEKYLKAFLLAKGWKLEKTHEISTLLKETCKYKPELGVFAELCKRVEKYYLTEGYPSSLDAGVSFDEVAKDFEEARQLREIILGTFAQRSDKASEEQNQSDNTEQRTSPNAHDQDVS